MNQTLWTTKRLNGEEIISCGKYKIVHRKYAHSWIIFCSDQEIGKAPLLYLAKQYVAEHAKKLPK